MKTNFLGKSTVGIALAALWLASDPFAQLANAQTPTAPPAPTPTADASAIPPASVTPPPNILPNSPLAQVIRLVQAGVDESIVLTYITNSSSTFNLDSDRIIYLSDLGVPNNVVSAMLERDQVMQQQMAAASTPPPPVPETPATEPVETPPPPAPAEVTVNYFYTSLAPYGTWVEVPDYGRCWRPTMVVYNSGWQPYCDRGHWVYSDCGWYWASDYSWGVTFHYGRWFHHPRMGWCWWPDTVWAPSWVTWRYSNDYCGWAPLPPFTAYRPGVGFFYHGSGVSIGFDFGLAVNCFTFVPTRNFCDPHPRHYRIGSRDETRIYSHTTVINNFNFDSHNRAMVNRGIEVQHITDATRTPIHPVPVRELGLSARQPWRGGSVGQPNRRPGVTPGSPAHPTTTLDNRSRSTPTTGTQGQNRFSRPGNIQNPHPNQTGSAPGQTRVGSPSQNHISQPGINRNPQPNYVAPTTPAQTPTWNNNTRHTTSPRGQQFEEQTPHHFTPPSNSGRNINSIRPAQGQTGSPAVNNSAPAARFFNSPPSSAPVERPQQHIDARPNVSAPAPRNVTPSAPPSSSAGHSSQPSQSSPSSNRSNNQNQNQNGRGH